MTSQGDGGRQPRDGAVLLLAAALHASLLVWLQLGYGGSDDLGYAKVANSILQGAYSIEPHPFSQRYLVTVPLAVVFYLFGVAPENLVLWPLLCSIGSLFLVFGLALRLFGRQSAWVALFLFLVSSAQLRYCGYLTPDPILAFWLVAGVFLIVIAREESCRSPRLLGAGAAVSFLMAFLAKETAIWVGPFLLFLLLVDVRRRRSLPFWQGFLPAALLLVFGYLASYYWLTGNALGRLESVSAHNESQWSFSGRGVGEYVRRLTYEPALYFLSDQDFCLLSSLLVAALFLPQLRRRAGLLLGYAGTFVGCFWLGSTSLTDYNPLPIAGRFFLAVVPVLCVLGGAVTVNLFARFEAFSVHKAAKIAFGFALFAGAASSVADGETLIGAWQLGSLVAWVLVLGALPRWSRRWQVCGLWGLASCALVPVAYMVWFYGLHDNSYRLEKRLVSGVLKEQVSTGEPVSLYTDPRSTEALELYFGFDSPRNLSLRDWRQLASATEGGSTTLVYFFQARTELVEEAMGVPVPAVLEQREEIWQRIAGTPSHGIYRLPASSSSGTRRRRGVDNSDGKGL